MNNKTIKILSRHNTLAEAVEAAKPDLSYNEREARQSINLTDRGYNRDRGTIAAFVCEDGKIRFVYQADIALLHEFSPFSSCLSDSPFELVFDQVDYLDFTGLRMTKNAKSRQTIRSLQAAPDNTAAGRCHALVS
jgi:hypothetical protein